MTKNWYIDIHQKKPRVGNPQCPTLAAEKLQSFRTITKRPGSSSDKTDEFATAVSVDDLATASQRISDERSINSDVGHAGQS
ncbi:MAG: hypothetical protein R3303_14965, partial [Marinobacter sp.]|nr:hypothetical protein [Marinobacter sp.]